MEPVNPETGSGETLISAHHRARCGAELAPTPGMQPVLNLPALARRPAPLARAVAPVEATRVILATDTRRAEPPRLPNYGHSDTNKVYGHVKTLASHNGPQALDVYF